MRVVSFRVHDRRHGVNLEAVERVIRAVEITPATGVTPESVGVINFHGQVMPVVAMRLSLGLPGKDLELTDKFVITRSEDRLMALWVDDVEGVIDFPSEQRVSGGHNVGEAGMTKAIVKTPQGLLFVDDLETLYERVYGKASLNTGPELP